VSNHEFDDDDWAPQCWLDGYLCADNDCCELGACEHLLWEFKEAKKREAALKAEVERLKAQLDGQHAVGYRDGAVDTAKKFETEMLRLREALNRIIDVCDVGGRCTCGRPNGLPAVLLCARAALKWKEAGDDQGK